MPALRNFSSARRPAAAAALLPLLAPALPLCACVLSLPALLIAAYTPGEQPVWGCKGKIK